MTWSHICRSIDTEIHKNCGNYFFHLNLCDCVYAQKVAQFIELRHPVQSRLDLWIFLGPFSSLRAALDPGGSRSIWIARSARAIASIVWMGWCSFARNLQPARWSQTRSADLHISSTYIQCNIYIHIWSHHIHKHRVYITMYVHIKYVYISFDIWYIYMCVCITYTYNSVYPSFNCRKSLNRLGPAMPSCSGSFHHNGTMWDRSWMNIQL